MTRTTKIFLASSSELIEDRKEFEIFIGRKNKEWVAQGAFIELVMWEDFIDAVAKTRLQDEYNKAILDCDIFVMLFYTKVGQYTEEEFETAFGQFKETNKPRIFTYFKDAEITTGSANKKDLTSLWAFQDKLDALGHFKTVYKNIDELKFHFDQQLDKLAASGSVQLKPEQSSESASTSKDRSALAELNTLGALILNLDYFKSIADRLRALYMDADVSFLRSQPAQLLQMQCLTRAVDSVDKALKDIRALEEPKGLSLQQKTLRDDSLNALVEAAKKLSAVAGGEPTSDKSDAQSAEGAITGVTRALTGLIGDFNKLAEAAWKKLGPWANPGEAQLDETLTRLRDSLSRSYPDYMNKVDQGYRALTRQPPLFVKCDRLANERELLEDALQALRLLVDTPDRPGGPSSACKRIKGLVDEAREYWEDFLGVVSKNDTWAKSLRAGGPVDWDEIKTCWEKIDAMLASMLAQPDQSQRSAFVSALEEAQRNIEEHLRAVDAALADAFAEVKNRLGEALTADPEAVAA